MENKLTCKSAYKQFKNEFYEDHDYFEKVECETGVNNIDGVHIQFGIVIVPYLYHLINIQNDDKIRIFFDRMSISSDKELSGVVQFSILEAIISNRGYFEKLKYYFTDEMNSYLPYLHSYIYF